MARGFIAGVFAGAVVSGAALAVASVLSGAPGTGTPETTALDVPAGSEFNQSRDDKVADLPQIEEMPQSGASPQVFMPGPDDLDRLSKADMAPSARPRTGAAEGVLSAPQIITDPVMDEMSDAAAIPETSPLGMGGTAQPVPTQPSMSQAPAKEQELSISTDPAQPAPPDIEEGGVGFAPQPEAGGDGPTALEDGDFQPESAPPGPEVAQSIATPDVMSEAPSGIIGNLAEGVATGRLPAITGLEGPQPGDTEAGAAESGGPESDGPDSAGPLALGGVSEDQPAIKRFAMPFENPDDNPIMSIILIDDGSSPIGVQALADFPYPLSFAVDASWHGAAKAAANYRAAGFEVLALADLPQNAGPTDTENAMQVILQAVPGAVALMEGTGTGLQSNRAAAEQLAPILREGGQGLVLFSKGLDTTQKLIAREGVPARTVFRDFDSKGQGATVIRRFLDQAAFKATRDEAGAIMVGRLRPDTISALLLWGLQDRASRVALAPISAVLQHQE